ncbi:HIT family protein [Rhodobacteraceae bacterium]|nr:HIT family protein [Paracoccaceae bacterium]
MDSPFLEKPKLLENEFGFVVYDGFPVSKGHCLVVPHRVYSNYFESTGDEIIGLQKLVVETKEFLDQEHQPDGYNIGINCGEVSGQTIPHVHIHVIPRYKGDMDNPKGGVRGVIPSKQKY